MAFQKRGTGRVLKDEDVKKTASQEQDDEGREQRLEELEKENREVDG